MKMRIAAVICSTLTGLMVLSSQAVAQQKTIKACQEEWSANKAANQANGITKKSYVDQCRAGSAPTQPAAAPAPSIAPPPSPGATARPAGPTQTVAGQKTIKACQEEWRANKAANQANGLTERAYVDQCRSANAPNSADCRSGCTSSGPYSGPTNTRFASAGHTSRYQPVCNRGASKGSLPIRYRGVGKSQITHLPL